MTHLDVLELGWFRPMAFGCLEELVRSETFGCLSLNLGHVRNSSPAFDRQAGGALWILAQ